jgi:hypothetical protein
VTRGWALAALGLLATGCNGILGIPDDVAQAVPAEAGDDSAVGDDQGAGDDGGTSDALDCFVDGDQNNACYSCDDQYCCPSQAACANDTGCVAYKTCMKKCTAPGADGGYNSCTLQCDSNDPSGHTVYSPYFACVQKNCLAPCGGNTTDPCTACLYASCTNEFYTCQSTAACDTMLACINLCFGDTNCETVCRSKGDSTVQEMANAVLTCAATYCSNVCQLP